MLALEAATVALVIPMELVLVHLERQEAIALAHLVHQVLTLTFAIVMEQLFAKLALQEPIANAKFVLVDAMVEPATAMELVHACLV